MDPLQPGLAQDLCLPAKITLALGVLSFLGSFTSGASAALVSLFSTLAWVWLMNALCKAGYPGGAWFLLFAPVIVVVLLLVVLAGSTTLQRG